MRNVMILLILTVLLLIVGCIQQPQQVVVVEENTFIGGLGSMIRQKLNNSGTYFANVALPDKFVEHGDAKVMRDKNGVSIKNIVKACKKLYKK